MKSAAVLRSTEHVTRVLAPNPSPMTLEGTNSYVIDAGKGVAVAIDPGPAHAEHVEALTQAARSAGLAVGAILVTHGHPDHAPGAALLSASTGAPVYAHPAARFPFDAACADGETLRFGNREIRAEHAPGHARDHLVFWFEDDAALFTGDVVVGRGTVVVAPPGGDMRAYQATLARLRSAYGHARVILGGHGPRVDDPRAKFDEYIAHRIGREAALLSVLRAIAPATIPQIVERLYVDVSRALWPAAARQVLAYLQALEREGRVLGRALTRAPTPFEASLLHPDLSLLVDPAAVAVARAELGFDDEGTPLLAYEVTGA